MLSSREIRARIANAPARLALRWCNLPPVRRYLASRHALTLFRHAPKMKSLSGSRASIIAGIKSRGIAITDLESLGLYGETRQVIADARRLGLDYADTAHRRAAAGKQLHHVPAKEICAHQSIYQLGLHPLFLDIAEAYLGTPVGYDGALLTYTVADGRATSTRRWHRDWEDRSTLKILLYLNDVGAQDGPFQLIPVGDARVTTH